MNALNYTTQLAHGSIAPVETRVSAPLNGQELYIGSGFDALSFRARDVGALMDPMVMIDHYVMTQPTFGAHPHAGMSAVSLLFEDSEGLFHNRDSLGNDFDLHPGDLYWLSAGSGAVHDESPRSNSRIHGLQVFVNVPQSRRLEKPASLLVRSAEMPVINTGEYRVKIALGESNGIRGAKSPSTPMTILDGTLQPAACFSHGAGTNRGIWVQAISGNLNILVDQTNRLITAGQAIAIKIERGTTIKLSNPLSEPVHFTLWDGEGINETYIQEGPFVMGTDQQIAAIKTAYEAGQLGSI